MFEIIAKVSNSPIPGLVVPGKLLRAFAGPVQIFRSIINLPMPVELLHYAGYGFYVNNHKSIKDLNFNYQYSAEQAIRDAYQWFQKEKQI